MINRDAWLRAVSETLPTSDPAAITMREFAEMLGVGFTTAKIRMSRLIKCGKAQVSTRVMLDGSGRTVSIPAYKLLDEQRETS